MLASSNRERHTCAISREKLFIVALKLEHEYNNRMTSNRQLNQEGEDGLSGEESVPRLSSTIIPSLSQVLQFWARETSRATVLTDDRRSKSKNMDRYIVWSVLVLVRYHLMNGGEESSRMMDGDDDTDAEGDAEMVAHYHRTTADDESSIQQIDSLVSNILPLLDYSNSSSSTAFNVHSCYDVQDESNAVDLSVPVHSEVKSTVKGRKSTAKQMELEELFNVDKSSNDMNSKCIRLVFDILDLISGNEFDHLVHLLCQFLAAMSPSLTHFITSCHSEQETENRLQMLHCIYSYLCAVILNQYGEQREDMVQKLFHFDFWCPHPGEPCESSTLQEMGALCMQHTSANTRLLFLSVCMEMAMLSESLCLTVLPIFERVLFVDCDELRSYAINCLWEMCIVFPSIREHDGANGSRGDSCGSDESSQEEAAPLTGGGEVEDSGLVSYLSQFLGVGSPEMQMASVHGVCRSLFDKQHPIVHSETIIACLAGCYCRLLRHDHEDDNGDGNVEDTMVQQQQQPRKSNKVSSSSRSSNSRKRKGNSKSSSTKPSDSSLDGNNTVLRSYLESFFQLYAQATEHQERIADAIVNRVIDAIDEKIIVLHSPSVNPRDDTIIEIRFLVQLLPARFHSTLIEVLLVNIQNCYHVTDVSHTNLKSWFNIVET